jgi:hypothetical protein
VIRQADAGGRNDYRSRPLLSPSTRCRVSFWGADGLREDIRVPGQPLHREGGRAGAINLDKNPEYFIAAHECSPPRGPSQLLSLSVFGSLFPPQGPKFPLCGSGPGTETESGTGSLYRKLPCHRAGNLEE